MTATYITTTIPYVNARARPAAPGLTTTMSHRRRCAGQCAVAGEASATNGTAQYPVAARSQAGRRAAGEGPGQRGLPWH